MSDVQTRSFQDLEAIIARGLETFVEVGSALMEIRERKLYFDQYKTFDDYCRGRWGFQRTRAYQLMNAAQVVMSTNVDIQNEAQARELARLNDEEEIIAVYKELKDEYGEEVTAGKIRKLVSRRLEWQHRRELAVQNRRRRSCLPALPPSIDLREGDFREVLDDIPDSSVDLIFTDPIYGKDGLHLWKDLSTFAARVLKPGKLLITYSGKTYVPHVIESLGNSLNYMWCGWVPNQSNYSPIHQYRIRGRGKLLLFYVKGDYKPGTWFDDMVWDNGPEKEHHKMQQSVDLAAYYIDLFTKPEQVVVDPYLGSGTTAVAAVRLKMKFIGAEIDAETLAQAYQRICEEEEAA